MTPLFVVGAPRSGTTLTRTLLRGFATVYLPSDEFQIMPAFLARAEGGASAAELAKFVESSAFASHMRRRGIWPGEVALAVALEGKAPAEAFRALVLAVADQEGVTPVVFWGDKTPETVFHLDLVARHWPEARVLEVTRDPRSTVLSMHRSWGRSLLRGAVIWRDAQRATRAFSETYGADRLYTLSFEALTANPSAELDRIGAWLGLTYDHSSLDEASSEERWGKASGTKGVQNRGADWEKAFSAAQIRQIEEICFAPMQAAGYAPTHALTERNPVGLRLKLAQLGDALRILQAYARERGWSAALKYKLSQWQGARS